MSDDCTSRCYGKLERHLNAMVEDNVNRQKNEQWQLFCNFGTNLDDALRDLIALYVDWGIKVSK